MAYVISDACVSCGTCAGECPVGAISEGDGKYVIDANACLDCVLAQALALQKLFLRNNPVGRYIRFIMKHEEKVTIAI